VFSEEINEESQPSTETGIFGNTKSFEERARPFPITITDMNSALVIPPVITDYN